MKVVILAGGRGTRLSEETVVKPKPMVEIGDKPILWHIMKIYSAQGFNEFIIALGYKGEVIKRFFLEYYSINSNVFVDLKTGETRFFEGDKEDWRVWLIDTGLDTNTGGRVLRLRKYIGDETFMLTYGDGVANINIRDLLEFHRKQGKIATITAVRPPARFGGIIFSDGKTDEIVGFIEKPQTGEGWINGGFMVFEPEVFDYIKDDSTSLEFDVLARLAREGKLTAYRHYDFWQCMDTLRDKIILEELWSKGKAPWKIWEI
ncbi:Glucose-1-phosphate cytidylyltransferase [bacterium HR19]|nr:Glucose-1-phosphate cytidylyltransferase [bacterium HR19]